MKIDCKAFVLMPYYNTRETLLKKSIKSVLEQNYKNIELVIYDDGTNNVVLDRVLKEFEYNLLKITVLTSLENNGTAFARNMLKHYVEKNANNNDLIFQLDSDDFYKSPDIISTIVEKMTKNNLDIILYPFEYNFLDDAKETDGLTKTKNELDYLVEKYVNKNNLELYDIPKITTLGCVKVCKVSLFKLLNDLNTDNEAKYEDFVWMSLFFKDNLKFSSITQKAISFSKYNNSTTSTRTKKDCEDVISRLNEFLKAVKKITNDENKLFFCYVLIKNKLDQYSQIFLDYFVDKDYKIVEKYELLKEDFKNTLKIENNIVFNKAFLS